MRSTSRPIRTVLAALTAASLLALAACGGPAPSTADDEAGDEPSGEIRLLTPIFEGTDGEQLLAELLDEFTTEYPDVQVSVDHTNYSKLNEKLTTSLASGRPYDVMMMGVGWIPPFADKGVLAELDVDRAELAQTYHERAIEPGLWQDKVYALPVMLDTRIGLYRKDLFADAGLTDPPRSLAEMRSYAKQLTQRDADGKLQVAGMDILTIDLRQAFEPLLWAAGGDLFGPDGEAAFNSPAGVEALQFMTDVIRTDKSEDIGFSQPGAATGIPLLQGRAAMMIGHNNVWTEMQQSAPELIAGDNIGAFLISDDRAAMFQGGTLAAMSARSPNPAAARALVELLASPEVSLRASEQRGNVPAAKAAADSDYVREHKFVQFAMEHMDSAFSEGGVPAWLEIRGEFKAAIESALLGEQTPKEALDKLAAKANDAMGQ